MKKVKTAIDLVMVLVLPILMGYSLVGEWWHEVVGITVGALFVLHHILNRKWITHLFKGRYNARRIVTTAINLLLCICVLTCFVSAVFISKHLFRFLGINVLSMQMRQFHLLANYWGFILISLHAGMHGSIFLSKLKKPSIKAVIGIAFIAALGYGVYAFIKHNFFDCLLMKTQFVFFDYSQPFILFFVDYLAVSALFMTVGFGISKLC